MWPKKKALHKALKEVSKKQTAEDLIKQDQYRRDKAQMVAGKMSKEDFKKKWAKYNKEK